MFMDPIQDKNKITYLISALNAGGIQKRQERIEKIEREVIAIKELLQDQIDQNND